MYEKKQLLAKYQVLEFCLEYARVVAEWGGKFARQVKEKKSWQLVGRIETDLDALAKPLYNHNALRQTSLINKKIAIYTIAIKWKEAYAEYIR